MRREISFDKAHGLSTTSWKDLVTKQEFMDPADAYSTGCQEFRFRAGDAVVTGSAKTVDLVSGTRSVGPDGTIHLDILLAARNAPVTVTVHLEAGPGQPAVRQYLSIKNTGSQTITLERLSIACGPVGAGPGSDLIAFGGYGEEPRENFLTGRVNDVAILQESVLSRNGFVLLSEVPGYLRRAELGPWNPGFEAMYDTDLFPFRRSLAPEESFDTAGVSILFYQRGTAEDPHWLIPKYVEDRIARNNTHSAPNWIYNNWEPFNGRIGAAGMKDIAIRAGEDGLSLLTIDEGWEARLGDNEVDRKRFPDGLEPVFDTARAAGMKVGLWLPVSLVAEDSQTYTQHPDWVCRTRDGKPKRSQGQGVMMCLGSPYKQAAVERIAEAVDRYKLSYVKLDLTTVFNTYGEEPGCYEQGHEHATPMESSERIYEGLQYVADSLHRRFPKLLIDYTFELWGEKHLIDYGLLRDADLDWLSNTEDHSERSAGPIQIRTLLYQRAMAIPTETMPIGNLQAQVPTWQEHAATAMGFAPLLLGDLAQQSKEEMQHYREWIERFNRLRSQVSLQESFFPLGAWRQPNLREWDGFGRFAHTGEGVLILFRNRSEGLEASVQIPGFPDGNFRLTPWGHSAARTIRGSDLRHGIQIAMPKDEPVQILEVRELLSRHTR